MKFYFDVTMFNSFDSCKNKLYNICQIQYAYEVVMKNENLKIIYWCNCLIMHVSHIESGKHVVLKTANQNLKCIIVHVCMILKNIACLLSIVK